MASGVTEWHSLTPTFPYLLGYHITTELCMWMTSQMGFLCFPDCHGYDRAWSESDFCLWVLNGYYFSMVCVTSQLGFPWLRQSLDCMWRHKPAFHDITPEGLKFVNIMWPSSKPEPCLVIGSHLYTSHQTKCTQKRHKTLSRNEARLAASLLSLPMKIS
jgi:hypothetical protein